MVRGASRGALPRFSGVKAPVFNLDVRRMVGGKGSRTRRSPPGRYYQCRRLPFPQRGSQSAIPSWAVLRWHQREALQRPHHRVPPPHVIPQRGGGKLHPLQGGNDRVCDFRSSWFRRGVDSRLSRAAYWRRPQPEAQQRPYHRPLPPRGVQRRGGGWNGDSSRHRSHRCRATHISARTMIISVGVRCRDRGGTRGASDGRHSRGGLLQGGNRCVGGVSFLQPAVPSCAAPSREVLRCPQPRAQQRPASFPSLAAWAMAGRTTGRATGPAAAAGGAEPRGAEP